MISSKFFRKQFVIAAISVFVCVFLGTVLLAFVARLTLPKPEDFQTPAFFRSFVEEEFGSDNVLAMKKLEHYLGQDDVIHLTLLDEKGIALYPVGAQFPVPRKLPDQVHKTIPLDGVPMALITRLNHTPARYLVERMDFPMGPGPLPPFPPPHGLPDGGPSFGHPAPNLPGPPMGGFGHLFLPASFLTLVLMVLVGIGVGLAIIFRSLKEAGNQADEVISELKRGNLKARFPVLRNDEIGAAMNRFNSMADEIERLVEKLRAAENSRNNVLQELTHDLRTPVASLRTILEGIFASASLNPEERELADLAEKEVEYLGNLAEDLLLLAQLTEPRFKASQGYVDLLTMLDDECEALERKGDEKIRIITRFHVDQALIQGDEHLFKRLVRNALENAHAYARSRIEVDVQETKKGFFHVSIRDDGDGFTPEALAKFGERRDQRSMRKTRDGKLSLGLGSVIMKSVVGLHGGTLRASNSGSGGAIVEFELPAGR